MRSDLAGFQPAERLLATGGLRLATVSDMGDRLVLPGAVDSFSCEQIRRLLARSHLTRRHAGRRHPGRRNSGRSPSGRPHPGESHPERATVTLDVAELSFIDARGLLTLARWGESVAGGGGRLVIEGVSPLMRRAWSVLGFDRLTAVELSGEAA